MAMKYKVGDIVSVVNKKGLFKILKVESFIGVDVIGVESGGMLNRYFLEQISDKSIVVIRDERLLEKHRVETPKQTTLNHESTIINLNDLNTAKSRQIERLMKFIAKDYTITNDLDYGLIRETLLKDIRDEDLVNAIMYHVRKGK